MLRGVESVEAGYASGGIEVIKVEFDPSAISYEDLLEVFFAMHDPTSRDRQGADVGTAYRSVVFTIGSEQEAASKKYIQKLESEKVFDRPIVTDIQPLDRFTLAEGFHQQYYKKNSDAPYCQVVINPKLAKVRSKFVRLLKE